MYGEKQIIETIGEIINGIKWDNVNNVFFLILFCLFSSNVREVGTAPFYPLLQEVGGKTKAYYYIYGSHRAFGTFLRATARKN